MEDVIQVQDQFYILATKWTPRDRGSVLKHGDTFAVFDHAGDIGAFGPSEQGLYHEGTRYLSRFGLRLNSNRPLLLSSRVKEDNELFGADLTNPDIPVDGEDKVLSRDLVHIFRARFLWSGALHERLRLRNYSRSPVRVVLSFDLAADFADIFEVRGTARARHGARLDPILNGRELRLGYRGLDDEERWTIIEWGDNPAAMSESMARFDYELAPQAEALLTIAIRCDRQHRAMPHLTFEAAESEALVAVDRSRAEYAKLESSSERFTQWVRRSAADLRMLVTRTAYGEYPYGGVPWFSTPFGRDGLIAGLQTLWINPRIARGVLEFLAATQADCLSERQDAEPGKILHETRESEMARLGEVPFGRYYGSVDSTPLFIILAGAYYERTADRAFLRQLWPHVARALAWIEQYGDSDGDGFVEYSRQSAKGLQQQGWKDSQDSVFHADGSLAEPPIALAEVQGYVYDARLRAARMADALGDAPRAGELRAQAEQLRAAFEKQFWCEAEGTYALALDGRKQRCRVISSNAGQCLFGGIAAPDRARRVAEQLVGEDMFSGWGIRTVAQGQARYNPMSYHNGSIWPHDNGLIASGFSRYGFDDLLGAPFAGLFDASATMEGHRLPELFCGFRRRFSEGPTLYPVACSPQAWSSGVVFHFIQSSLRLSIDHDHRRLSIHRAFLPPFLTYLRLFDLELPFGKVDLQFEQHPLDVSVTVLRKEGDFQVHVTK